MKKNGVRFISEMGVFIALGLVFDIVAKPLGDVIWISGGSISIAMVPIFIMSFRYGLKGGLISGIAIGSIQLAWSSNGIVHWAQAILDYALAYGIVGVSGVFAKLVYNNKGNVRSIIYANIAVFLAGTLRTICHIISGVVFFSQEMFADGVAIHLIWFGSTTYNVGYMAPSIVLCMIVITILVYKYFSLLEYVDLKNPS